nr:MAG: hypothetical protein DIU61_16445 [Bacteroidota bacterium]
MQLYGCKYICSYMAAQMLEGFFLEFFAALGKCWSVAFHINLFISNQVNPIVWRIKVQTIIFAPR